VKLAIVGAGKMGGAVLTGALRAGVLDAADVGVYHPDDARRAVLAQRLVRKLCDSCKAPHEASADEKAMFGLPAAEALDFYRPVGCMACAQTGYQGRLGVYELLLVDQEMRRLIREDVSEDDLEAHAFAGHDTLFRNAARYVASGQTSVEEVLRVCRREEDA
jgi:general secretion pathway protein E